MYPLTGAMMSKALVCLMSLCAISVAAFLLSALPVIASPRAFAETAKKSAAHPETIASTRPTVKTMVDINKADRATLQKLPGIGRVKAEAIIAGRPYLRIEDIMKIKGIKQKTFQGIRDQIEAR
jgi:competence ComEA-like helix-hairpin-helix protein